jgi:omega-amidase
MSQRAEGNDGYRHTPRDVRHGVQHELRGCRRTYRRRGDACAAAARTVDRHRALVGSFNCEEQGKYFNRAFFVTPSHLCYFYDKRHLFRMGEEADHFSAGSKQLIIPYKGFNIALLVCYDLRFPVWSRNRDNGYDVLVYVANWPASRRKVWDTLLRARALENMSYVIGVNRVGTDGYKLPYDGGSIVISAKGETLASVADNTEGTATVSIDTESLIHFRNKFPVWKDADAFKL